MAHPRSKIQPRQSADAVEILSASVEETQAVGERLGGMLQAGDVVALRGELGTGKTTLIQGIAKGLGRDPQTIKSPTFVLMREYPDGVPLVHIDGYRLEGPDSVARPPTKFFGGGTWLDVELIFSPSKITLIEWAERFADLLPEERLEIHLDHVSTNRRRIALVPYGPRALELANALTR